MACLHDHTGINGSNIRTTTQIVSVNIPEVVSVIYTRTPPSNITAKHRLADGALGALNPFAIPDTPTTIIINNTAGVF